MTGRTAGIGAIKENTPIIIENIAEKSMLLFIPVFQLVFILNKSV